MHGDSFLCSLATHFCSSVRSVFFVFPWSFVFCLDIRIERFNITRYDTAAIRVVIVFHFDFNGAALMFFPSMLASKIQTAWHWSSCTFQYRKTFVFSHSLLIPSLTWCSSCCISSNRFRNEEKCRWDYALNVLSYSTTRATPSYPHMANLIFPYLSESWKHTKIFKLSDIVWFMFESFAKGEITEERKVKT